MKECPVCRGCFDDVDESCREHGAVLLSTFDGSRVIDGRYTLISRLGQGGMGLIYRARHQGREMGLDRDFALKVIKPSGPPSSDFLELFRNEAKTLGKLNHPSIVRVTDSGVDPRGGGLAYFVTELLEGEGLDAYCRRLGPLSLEAALPLLRGVAAAIDYVHRQGLLHRDVKPANVFLARVEGVTDPEPRLLDFGLAAGLRWSSPTGAGPEPLVDPAAQSETVTHQVAATSQPQGEAPTLDEVPTVEEAAPVAIGPREASGSPFIVGTPHYMAPEVVEGGEATSASDVYAFGVLAYFLLAGRHPFEGSLRSVLDQHRSGSPPELTRWNPNLPVGVDSVLRRALEKDLRLRPPTATALVARLQALAARARVRAWKAVEGPRRLAAALLLGLASLAATLFLGESGFLADLEGRSMDARFVAAPRRPPDPRVVLVVLDEASLDPALPLAAMDQSMLRLVERLFSAQARAVALDFVLPELWARTGWSRLVREHETRLTLAAFATADASKAETKVVGTEVLDPLVRGALAGDWRLLFGLDNLDRDRDGMVRRGRLFYPAEGGGKQASFAARAVSTLDQGSVEAMGCPAGTEARDRFWIDYTIDRSLLRTISWRSLDEALRQEPEAIRERLVLVGGDMPGMENAPHSVPGGETVPGVTIQAVAASTVLGGCPLRGAGGLPSVATSALATAAFAGVLLGRRLRWTLAACATGALAYVGAAFWAFGHRALVLPLAGPLVFGALGLVVALSLRRLWPEAPPDPAFEASAVEPSA